MKKETISKIEEEINQKITLPNNIKEKVKKDVFTNIIIAISMIVYFTFLIMGSVGTVKSVRSVDFNIFSILLLSVSIYLFEIAYKKDNGTLAIYGVETLVVSIITLFFPYIIFELDEFSKKYYMIVSAYIAVYYIIKSIWIVSKAKKIHIKQSSDIKEIVKKEKRKDIIRVKEKNDTKKVDANKKEKTNEKKSTTAKIKKDIIIVEKNDIPKKRGRPRKTQTEAKEEIKKEETTPKRRGRPRKVVTADD